MMQDFLPIGSVVLLKGAKKRIMITGFCASDKKHPDKVFNYGGCIFPEGIVDSNKMILFNHKEIDKVFFIGLNDFESNEFRKKLNIAIKEEIENK